MNSLFILRLSLLPFQYSLDNEAERQKLEHEAERLRGGGLGGQRRAQHVEALRRVEAELEGVANLGGGTSNSTSPLSSTRSGGSSLRMADPSTSSMMMRPPRSSANLEQLYHEALPAPPILSNSGPPNLVYSSASNLFHQVSFGSKHQKIKCTEMPKQVYPMQVACPLAARDHATYKGFFATSVPCG